MPKKVACTYPIASADRPRLTAKASALVLAAAVLTCHGQAWAQAVPTPDAVPTTQSPPSSPEEEGVDPFAVPETGAPPAGAAAAIETETKIAAPVPPAQDSASTILAGKLIFELRPRYEFVDQTGFAREAKSATLRTRLGWETSAFRGFRALLEFENVSQLNGETYNTTLNGKTTFPVIADPTFSEINRAQVSWSNGPNLSVVAGRQRINLDDQRFVGGIAWRQDEQTFDGIKADFGLGKLRGSYTFFNRVNRIFAEALDWEGDSHLLNLNYAISEPLKLQAFAYNLDFGGTGKTAANLTAARNASTDTLGARLSGKVWAGLIGISYGYTYAQQKDAGANPVNVDLGFSSAELIGNFDIYTLRLGYEVAEGNGVRNFVAPLGTAHAFQGWADAFEINSPTAVPNGVEDLNLTVNLRPRWRKDKFFNLDFTFRYHDFQTQRTGIDIGTEFDAQFTAAFTPQLSMIVKAAKFDGTDLPGSFADRTKIWVGLEYRL
jgi:Alginate export